jgi:hypothetical protein
MVSLSRGYGRCKDTKPPQAQFKLIVNIFQQYCARGQRQRRSSARSTPRTSVGKCASIRASHHRCARSGYRRRRRTISFRAIAPAAATLEHVHDPADHLARVDEEFAHARGHRLPHLGGSRPLRYAPAFTQWMYRTRKQPPVCGIRGRRGSLDSRECDFSHLEQLSLSSFQDQTPKSLNYLPSIDVLSRLGRSAQQIRCSGASERHEATEGIAKVVRAAVRV